MGGSALILTGKEPSSVIFGEMLKRELEERGFAVCTAFAINGKASYDLVLWDADALEEDFSHIRAYLDCPCVIFYSEREESARKFSPCFIRPFSFETLMSSVPETEGKRGGISIDPESRSVTAEGLTVALTELEFALFSCLAEAEGRTLSREEIAEKLWKDGGTETNRIDVYINYLRKKIDLKLGRRIIITERNRGYKIKL